jgi:undecaprenyl-diphosphatase
MIYIIIIGFLLFLAGLSYQVTKIRSLDQIICLKLNYFLKQQPYISLFYLLWPFGMTVFTLAFLLFLVIVTPFQGIAASLGFLFFGAIDRLIKHFFNRKRPFTLEPPTVMLQPKKPFDASFPSGDTFHIWFLVFTLISIFHLPPLALCGMILLALLIGLGRIALGVHFPLDVIAGAGLGLMSAGTGMLIYNIFSSGWLTIILKIV